MKFSLLLSVLGCAAFSEALAEVKPNPVFADNAVLQQGMEVPIWGTARDGESVTVEFQGQKVTSDTKDGKWMVRLAKLKAGGPFEMTIKGDNSVILKNLLVGEVWICGGQSNMEWALSRSDGGANAIADATNPMLRMCRVPHNVQAEPQTEVKVTWQETVPATAKNFSAIPYWFGNKLQKELGVPVGIVNSAFGGTAIQSWLPAETLKNGPWPQDKWSDPVLAKKEYDERVEKAKPIKEKYEAEKAAAIANKQPVPPQPPGIMSEYKGPVTLWNGEIAPLLPLAVRGVAWYQGESNAYVNISDNYGDFLRALIADWRAGFKQPNLPFIIFQIARNRKWQADPNEPTGIAVLQEAQAKVAFSTPNATLVVTTDMGGPDVHYTGKEPIADRAVKAALSLAYEKPAEYLGPIFKEMKVEDGKARISFTHTAGGLKTDGGPLSGFVIAGADKKFVFADAVIDGETVVVSSPQVPAPVAVRYGWADLPKVNLFSNAGLPAMSFRTDGPK